MKLGRATFLVALVLALYTLGDEPASAHGPCGCLTPASGPPGTTVTAAVPAYKVVFNPDRTDLPITQSLWRAHRPGVAPSVVSRKTYSYSDLPLTGRVDFRVPAAPPGRYLVSFYDGSEGGAHYTWEYLRVTDEQAQATPPRPADPGPPASAETTRVPLPTAVLAAVAALLAGLLLGGLAAGSGLPGFKRQ